MLWQISATAFYHIFCHYYTLFAIFRLHELRYNCDTVHYKRSDNYIVAEPFPQRLPFSKKLRAKIVHLQGALQMISCNL